MSMGAVWTREAEASFRSILTYLESEWGGLVADAFTSDVLNAISLIQVFSNAGIVELRDKGIRSIPVARQVRLFYRVVDELIIILEFIDTRSEQFQGMR